MDIGQAVNKPVYHPLAFNEAVFDRRCYAEQMLRTSHVINDSDGETNERYARPTVGDSL